MMPVFTDEDSRPMMATPVNDLRVWNYDGSSTGQAEGDNSEILLLPVAIFNDPFRGAPHILVLAEADFTRSVFLRATRQATGRTALPRRARHLPTFLFLPPLLPDTHV